MPTATIGIMDKKINSTKTSFSGTSHKVVLKAPTSRENPKLLITGSPTSKANYMSYAGWYYWVDDIVSVTRDLSWVVGHVDPLATWKDDIKATTGFINFGPASKVNNKIVDPRFTADVYESTGGVEVSLHDFNADGYAYLVVADYTPGSAGVKHIIGDLGSFMQLYNDYITDLDTDITSFAAFDKFLGKALGLGNGLEYIMDARFVPLNKDTFSDDTYSGGLGPYAMSGSWSRAKGWGGYGLTHEYTQTLNTTIAHREKYPWLQHPNYTKILIQTPGGVLDLSSNLQLNSAASTKIVVRQIYNVMGDICLVFYEQGSHIVLGTQNFNVSTDLKHLLINAPSPSVLGAKLGAQIGLTAVSAMAGAGGVMASAGEKIGSAALDAGSELGLKAGVGMINAGEKLAAQSQGFMKTFGTGISGAAASISVSESIPQFGGPNNLTAMNFINDDISSKHVMFRCEYWSPEIIAKDHYDAFVDEYGGPVFDYGTMSVDGPYQMAGATCSADAPPASLSTINSTINNFIIIE